MRMGVWSPQIPTYKHRPAHNHRQKHKLMYINVSIYTHQHTPKMRTITCMRYGEVWRGGGLGSSTIFNQFNEPYAPS